MLVLIDTWWNVNSTWEWEENGGCLVLIDTWWNVNYISFQLYLPRIGFNRYMVECESRFLNRIFYHFLVLIDTWWNVNIQALLPEQKNYIVLIDTWWNVNHLEEINRHDLEVF